MKISDIFFEEKQYDADFYKAVEDKVLELKKNKDSFKDRYGDDWENVMYGTATNLVKKELGID